MAAFKRRSTKNSDENQATNEQTELELDNVTENSNLENGPQTFKFQKARRFQKVPYFLKKGF